uniref:DUF8204 domain-containing protein n=1 Tax=Aegilops tauschii TaxID=37682 RepID=R7WGI0_AEGTA
MRLVIMGVVECTESIGTINNTTMALIPKIIPLVGPTSQQPQFTTARRKEPSGPTLQPRRGDRSVPPLTRKFLRRRGSTGERRIEMGEASPESSGAAAGGPSIPGPPRKGKSCKGCLYYSSVLKSRGYNPICVGIPRSIPQVPGFVVEEPREEAAAQGHDLRQFKYACAGYSMFVDDRDAKSGENDAKALLPYCQGLEM